jgi:DNA-binding PadR family transcriptional regulator
MKLTKAEERVLKVLTMMHGRGILIPDEQATGDHALQRLCKKNLVVKSTEKEGFHRYQITEIGVSEITAASQS